jgi:hypothetical protein
VEGRLRLGEFSPLMFLCMRGAMEKFCVIISPYARRLWMRALYEDEYDLIKFLRLHSPSGEQIYESWRTNSLSEVYM